MTGEFAFDPVAKRSTNIADLRATGKPHLLFKKTPVPRLELLKIDGRMLEVRYEEVVADLETQARRIIAHCGLDWDPRCLSFHTTERPVRTSSVAQVRQPLYPGAVGRAHRYDAFLGPLRGALAGG